MEWRDSPVFVRALIWLLGLLAVLELAAQGAASW